MNRQRRHAIGKLINRFEVLTVEVEGLRWEIDGLLEEERDYYDNMPESFQDGTKGEAAVAAIDQIEEALSALEEIEAAAQSAVEALNGAVA